MSETSYDHAARPSTAFSTTPIDLRGSSTNPRQAAVLGAGGHGRELADIIDACAKAGQPIVLLGIADDGAANRKSLARSGVRFLGDSAVLKDRLDIDVHIGVGSPEMRRHLVEKLGARSAPLIHPSALVGSDSSLGAGVVLAQGVILTTNVTIGAHTHVNVGCSISHDCRLGDFVTVSPRATLTGNVRVDSGAFIGAAATILPGVHIGANAIVGAGAVVTRDVAPSTTVAGVPAQRI